jgi:hypothetical protein
MFVRSRRPKFNRTTISDCTSPAWNLLNDPVKFSLNLFYLVNADFALGFFVELLNKFGYIFRNAFEIETPSNANVLIAHADLQN